MLNVPSGHHPDGSGIQKHSAGSHYPFVVGMQEGFRHPWFVMSPSGKVLERYYTCLGAIEGADIRAKFRRDHPGVFSVDGMTSNLSAICND
jgi:hypothetical protein